MELQKRKPNRLKNYDYSQNGAYFITICTNKRKCILSTIDNYESRAGACSCRLPNSRLAPAEIKLTKYGKIAEEQLFLLKNRFQGIIVDKYTLLKRFLANFDYLFKEWEQNGFSSIRTKWLKSSYKLHQTIKVGDIEGIFEDIDNDGTLIVKMANGKYHFVKSGDVF